MNYTTGDNVLDLVAGVYRQTLKDAHKGDTAVSYTHLDVYKRQTGHILRASLCCGIHTLVLS